MKRGGTIVIEDGGYVYEEETHFTAMKTSLFFDGDGFAVYNSTGELIFRVDSYGSDSNYNGELVLMDASGRCLLTVRRKRPSLHQRWEGFVGERIDGQKPIFSVRRSSIMGRSNVSVETYTDSPEEYSIEGLITQRSCIIYDSERTTVGEISRKVDADRNVVLGKDTFALHVKAGFDVAFAMGLVLVLDQINGDDDEEEDEYVEDGEVTEADQHHNSEDAVSLVDN